MKNIIHGGDIDFIEKTYKIPKEEIIDFSSNINPLGFPESVKTKLKKHIDIITTYPDKNYENLKLSIQNYLNIKIPIENILVGNGTTELISIFIKTLAPKNSLLLSPSYSEYEREIKNIKGNINYFHLLEKDNFNLNIDNLLNSLENINLLVICNPNNPTGTLITSETLEKVLTFCLKNNTFVMIDETYIEFSGLNSKFSAVYLTSKYKNLFVIRGTSKFFCVPGVRLGYALCTNQNILSNINRQKDLWSVNSFANLAGITMFKDINFIKSSFELINSEKIKIYNTLENIKNLKYYKSYSNFILVKILNKKITSPLLFDSLIKNKILIRDASNFESLDDSFFRFCILTPEKNTLILNKLKILLN